MFAFIPPAQYTKSLVQWLRWREKLQIFSGVFAGTSFWLMQLRERSQYSEFSLAILFAGQVLLALCLEGFIVTSSVFLVQVCLLLLF